ncbi:MAG: hypothetical protein ACYDEX_16460 [Mobilitalea sp.]
MKWLLVVVMIFIFGLGFLVVSQIDKFLNQATVSRDVAKTVRSEKPFAFIFGSTEIADKLMLILKKNSIEYRQIEDENQLNPTDYFSHLFALSDNDLNNLMIGVIANRCMQAFEKIAICNSIDNQTIYKQNKIRYLSSENITAEALFNTMFPSVDKAKENRNDN